MFLRKRKRNRFKFTEKSHSRKGIISFVISVVLLLLYGVILMLAYRSHGELSAYYGSVGIVAVLVSVVTLVFSFQSLFEEDSFPIFPRLSLVTSLLAAGSWIGTLVLGCM